jgi:hypothetical protein
VPKIAAAVLAFVCLTLLSIPASAQLLPRGNVYGGVSYGQLTNVINKQSYRGWEASAEDLPFARFPHLGFVLDGNGYYRSGVTMYSGLFGPRLSTTYRNWRPFAHAMAGVRHINANGFVYNPIALDFGGGVDYKLPFKNFSWRVQGDFVHTHYASAIQNDFRASTGIVWRF